MDVPISLLTAWKDATKAVFLSGAGISAESGLATFRGSDGLWEGANPADVATPEAFIADPEYVWRFYAWRRAQAIQAKPNAAHQAIAQLVKQHPDHRVVTQNVDGLHERAGTPDVLCLHGSIWNIQCTECRTSRTDLDPNLGAEALPYCECGGLERPGVVWFGEPLDGAILQRAERWIEHADFVVVVGTSGLVYPAAGLPSIAFQQGVPILEIGPEETAITEIAGHRISGLAGEWIPKWIDLKSQT